jgi:hypothetical protein
MKTGCIPETTLPSTEICSQKICTCRTMGTIHISKVKYLAEGTSACEIVWNGKVFRPIILDNTWEGEWYEENKGWWQKYAMRIYEIVEEYGFGVFSYTPDKNSLPVITGRGNC